MAKLRVPSPPKSAKPADIAEYKGVVLEFALRRLREGASQDQVTDELVKAGNPGNVRFLVQSAYDEYIGVRPFDRVVATISRILVFSIGHFGLVALVPGLPVWARLASLTFWMLVALTLDRPFRAYWTRRFEAGQKPGAG